VYLIYGMYHMLNIVTDRKDYSAAVLIRGMSGCSGPGRVTKILHVTKALNGIAVGKKNRVWFEDRGTHLRKRAIRRTPRIGIPYAEEWKDKPYRFVLLEHEETFSLRP
jgi:DNA-3-methyladenine glycosylase